MARITSNTTTKRGRKPDVAGIKAEVRKQWGKMEKQILTTLGNELPTRRVDAKKHVVRVASRVISSATRSRRAR